MSGYTYKWNENREITPTNSYTHAPGTINCLQLYFLIYQILSYDLLVPTVKKRGDTFDMFHHTSVLIFLEACLQPLV